jgi:leader peptidase (prepilin peptidase) / N-methyltransferase
MEWWFHVPVVMWCATVFALGLVVGSFLNVLIARLPYEKSVLWPNSRCFTCYQPIRLTDNLPIIGYLRLRGKCRSCGAKFSPIYLWVEVTTGLLFLAIFLIECLSQSTGAPDFVKPWHFTPGLKFSLNGVNAVPPPAVLIYWAIHAFLVAWLLAAAVIDAEHQIIPTHITYTGTLVGLVVSTLCPWPWPSLDPNVLNKIPTTLSWILPETLEKIPTGVMPWPCWGPPPSWAPAGSWKLGLLSSVVGAAFGMMLVRGIKFLFEIGLGKEALGLGDADLLMMVGAFLGWQIVFIGFFMGALAALALKVPMMILDWLNKRDVARELSFGPGLALGVCITWMGWPWISERAQVLFEPIALAILAIAMGAGLLIAGMVLRRK